MPTKPQESIPLQTMPQGGREATAPPMHSPLSLPPMTPGHAHQGVGGRVYPEQVHGTESRLDAGQRAAALQRPAGTPETALDLPAPVTHQASERSSGWSFPTNPTRIGKAVGLTALGAAVVVPAGYGTAMAIKNEINSNHRTPASPQPTTTAGPGPTAMAQVNHAHEGPGSPSTASTIPSHITIPGQPGEAPTHIPLRPNTLLESISTTPTPLPPGAIPTPKVPDP